jgi:hypothetical protein
VNVDHVGQTVADLVLVGVDADGRFSLYSQFSTQLVVDVVGYFTPVPESSAGRLVALDPVRVLDTRRGLGASGPLPPGGNVALTVTGPVPSSAEAVVMTLVATETLAPGYVQALATGSSAFGRFANLNVDRARESIANTVIVPLGPGGSVTFFSQSATHLVGDVVGYITGPTAPASAAGLFVPLRPQRIMDSRTTGVIPGGGSLTIPVAGQGPLPGTLGAVAGTLIATGTTASGWVQVLPTGAATAIGATASLHVNGANRTIAAATVLGTPAGSVTAHTLTATHLIYDVTGEFTPATP